METDTALCRASRKIVLHAIAGVDLELAGVALKWNRKDDLARWMRENPPHSSVELKQVGGLVKIRDRVTENGNLANRGLS